MFRKLLIAASVGVLVLAALMTNGGAAPMAGNCTFFVGTGTNGCFPTSWGTLTGVDRSTSGRAVRTELSAFTSGNPCMESQQRLVIWYTNPDTGALIARKWGTYGACSVTMGGSNGQQAKAWCDTQHFYGPPSPRVAICFTRW